MRDRGEERERGERRDQSGVAAHRDAAVLGVGIARRVLVEEDDVLGHPQRVEAERFGRAAGRFEVGAIAAGMSSGDEDADLHGSPPETARLRRRLDQLPAAALDDDAIRASI